MDKLYWIFPCYNEEECLASSSQAIVASFNQLLKDKKIAPESKLVFIDDGSKDKTWSIIEDLAKNNSAIIGLKLSRNKGHQYAVEAGLQFSYDQKADFSITMDVDLQDDINVVSQMVDKYLEGNDIVYGVRNNRKSDSFFKRQTANSYYRLMKKMGVELVENAADFRLLSYRAMGALLSYQESNLFLRGIVPQIGYPTACVEYERLKRKEGKTHYPLSKMLLLAMDGMTSFSSKPLSFIGKCGGLIIALSLVAALTFMILNLTRVLGFSIYYYLFPFISLNAGLILVALGIIGLYLSKVNIEVKKRPHYFIEKTTEKNKD